MDDFGLKIKSYSANHIDSVMVTDSTSQSLRLIGIYGFLDTSRKVQTWNLLRLLQSQMDIHWLCVEDFNELRYLDEKLGGAPQSNMIYNFNSIILDCGFHEVQFTGHLFTWHMSGGSKMVLERLNRVLANKTWPSLFPYAVEQHLISETSDHLPLLFVIIILLIGRLGRRNLDLRICG